MRRVKSNRLRLAVICAVIALAVVFVFDLLQHSPVMADVVERHGVAGNGTEQVTVSWVDGEGLTQTADVIAHGKYVGESPIPIIPISPNDVLSPYVHSGWLSLNWYFSAALVGLFFGGVVATGLRGRDYEESPIREVTWGSGI